MTVSYYGQRPVNRKGHFIERDALRLNFDSNKRTKNTRADSREISRLFFFFGGGVRGGGTEDDRRS